MRRVLDGLVWVFLTSLVGGSFWYFSPPAEPDTDGLHAYSNVPAHIERCRSCLHYYGRPSSDKL